MARSIPVPVHASVAGRPGRFPSGVFRKETGWRHPEGILGASSFFSYYPAKEKWFAMAKGTPAIHTGPLHRGGVFERSVARSEKSGRRSKKINK